MANPLDAIVTALGYLGEGARNKSFFDKFGPNWREEIDFQRATRANQLQSSELGQAQSRLTLADQLSNLIGQAAMGQTDLAGDVQRTVDPMVMGAEDGGLGYAANVPMAATVPTDPADVVPDDLGELTGFSREAMARLGLGKAAQSKRALAELRGDQALAAISARSEANRGRDTRRQSFQREMEEFKHGNRVDLTKLGATLRERLAAYNQGQTNSRFEQNYEQDERQFYDRLNQTERQWEANNDLRQISARRQVLSAELDRDANLSEQGRAQIVFELGILNGKLANMGLKPSVVVPQAQPGTRGGPPDRASSVVPNEPAGAGPAIPSWVVAIVQKGAAATQAERQRVAAWRASVGR